MSKKHRRKDIAKYKTLREQRRAFIRGLSGRTPGTRIPSPTSRRTGRPALFAQIDADRAVKAAKEERERNTTPATDV